MARPSDPLHPPLLVSKTRKVEIVTDTAQLEQTLAALRVLVSQIGFALDNAQVELRKIREAR